MDTPLVEYRYKRRFGWGEWFIACTWLILACFIVYRLINDSEYDWTKYILAILYGSIFIVNSIKALLQYKFSEIRINSKGIYYHFSLWGYLSWSITWTDLNQAYYNKKWYQKVLTLLPSKDCASQANKLIEVKHWRQVDSATAKDKPIHHAVEQFTDLKDSIGMQSQHHPLAQDLGRAAERASMVIAMMVVTCLGAGFYVHRFVTVSHGIPVWTMVLGGVIGALLTVLYLVKNRAQAIAIPIISLLAAVAGAFLFAISIKSSIIFWGTDDTLDFELVKKTGGYQQWQAIDDRSLFLELGYQEAKARTNAEQGDVIKLDTRTGILSITVLLPGEVDKTKGIGL